ncbi:MAG: hypothetical protein NW226_13985 [Microscillaceae bacterium]|nr:hypothetical protein [Microscillaceae bacterium]
MKPDPPYDPRVPGIVKGYSPWIYESFSTSPNTGFDELERYAFGNAKDSKRVKGATGEGIVAYVFQKAMEDRGFTVDLTEPSVKKGASIDSQIVLHPNEDVDVRLDVDIGAQQNYSYNTLFTLFYEPDGSRDMELYFTQDTRFDFEVKTWGSGNKPASTAKLLATEIETFTLDAVILRVIANEEEYQHVPVFLTDKKTWEDAYKANPGVLEKAYNTLKAQGGKLYLLEGLNKAAEGHLQGVKRAIIKGLK